MKTKKSKKTKKIKYDFDLEIDKEEGEQNNDDE